ncbi:flagellar hook-length control protein FliK [Stutzerimonas decontaminans]|jgi:flagellar hook-length control protein FliK|uniref:Flagellar hook-length control protein FliK n=2 Tax=Stutzerimonas TaxID=2901164 RepID=A0ABX4VVM6_9GAMM|nr:flagellar hook-length control protein FliK [Stutzerimonas decontaminans]AHY44854.1 flagellar hook-length control protein [Stutzerimonas decontaminans]MCQ4244833.1 flagellar hook-length control protein FliK [Stutzerimonas decontaminans]PNF84249.1 flagellar hook-length control protein FliK [Stutzerimonas decontaminans]
MQLISASAPATAVAEALAQPLRPASLGGHAAARTADVPTGFASEFHARMLGAALDLDVDALQQPLEVQAPALPLALAEPVVEAGADEAEQGPAELWLLGMLDQQQVQVQAREAAVQLGWPVAPEQPGAAPDGQAGAVIETQFHSRVTPLPAGLPGQQLGDQLVDRPLPAAPVARPVIELGAALNQLGAGAAGNDLGAELAVEPLRELASIDEGSQSAPLVAERPASSVAQGAERLLKLQAPEAKWGEQMLHALREHVEVQLQQRQQSASIRLDPPELGSLEIHLSHESGRLTVQLSAAHADVARLLQQTSDRLRQELVAQHFVQVNVQVGADGQSSRQGQSQQGHDGDAVLAATAPASAAVAADGGRRSAGRGNDVLVTV